MYNVQKLLLDLEYISFCVIQHFYLNIGNNDWRV